MVNQSPPPVLNYEVLRRTLLIDEQEVRENFRGRINDSMADEDKDGEITTCNKMLEYITKDDNSDIKWKF
jgi:hypothetical protein